MLKNGDIFPGKDEIMPAEIDKKTTKIMLEMFQKGYHFGPILAAIRLIHAMTLKDVADAVGSFKGYMSMIETGKVKPPSKKVLPKLAKVFKVDPKLLALIAAPEQANPTIQNEVREALEKWMKKQK